MTSQYNRWDIEPAFLDFGYPMIFPEVLNKETTGYDRCEAQFVGHRLPLRGPPSRLRKPIDTGQICQYFEVQTKLESDRLTSVDADGLTDKFLEDDQEMYNDSSFMDKEVSSSCESFPYSVSSDGLLKSPKLDTILTTEDDSVSPTTQKRSIFKKFRRMFIFRLLQKSNPKIELKSTNVVELTTNNVLCKKSFWKKFMSRFSLQNQSTKKTICIAKKTDLIDSVDVSAMTLSERDLEDNVAPDESIITSSASPTPRSSSGCLFLSHHFSKPKPVETEHFCQGNSDQLIEIDSVNNNINEELVSCHDDDDFNISNENEAFVKMPEIMQKNRSLQLKKNCSFSLTTPTSSLPPSTLSDESLSNSNTCSSITSESYQHDYDDEKDLSNFNTISKQIYTSMESYYLYGTQGIHPRHRHMISEEVSYGSPRPGNLNNDEKVVHDNELLSHLDGDDNEYKIFQTDTTVDERIYSDSDYVNSYFDVMDSEVEPIVRQNTMSSMSAPSSSSRRYEESIELTEERYSTTDSCDDLQSNKADVVYEKFPVLSIDFEQEFRTVTNNQQLLSKQDSTTNNCDYHHVNSAFVKPSRVATTTISPSHFRSTTPQNCVCSRCKSDCTIWDLCQPVSCIIDQNEVEILPSVHDDPPADSKEKHLTTIEKTQLKRNKHLKSSLSLRSRSFTTKN